MTEYDDYLYPNFVPNINFVAKNIKLTHELVNSIENEVQEVKVLIQQKIQRQTDFQQLLTLINQERDLLHVNLTFILQIKRFFIDLFIIFLQLE